MLRWYVLRRASSFVIAHIDHQGALLWHEGCLGVRYAAV